MAMRTALFFSLLGCVFMAPAPGLALSSGGIGGFPAYVDPGIKYSDSWFIYSLDAGESKQDSIKLVNSSDEVQAVKLYPVDSVATGDGNFSLRNENDPREGVGGWIVLSESIVTLNPGQEYSVPFIITIPENVSVGEHSGGIILQKAAPPTALGEGQTGASIVTRVGIRVYETVPGTVVKKIDLSGFSVKRETPLGKSPVYRATLLAKNTSNVSMNADVSLAITGWGKTAYFPNSKFKDGLYLDFGDFTSFFKGETLTNQLQLLRDQEVSTYFDWPMPAFGKYVFQATVSYNGIGGRESFSTKPITVWVMPWKELGVLAGIIILLFLWSGISSLLGRGRSWVPYTVLPGDQLGTIAVAAGISWKKLAKANRLKNPTVSAGQKLMVPRTMKQSPATPSIAPAVRDSATSAVQQTQPATTPRVLVSDTSRISEKPKKPRKPRAKPAKKPEVTI